MPAKAKAKAIRGCPRKDQNTDQQHQNQARTSRMPTPTKALPKKNGAPLRQKGHAITTINPPQVTSSSAAANPYKHLHKARQPYQSTPRASGADESSSRYPSRQRPSQPPGTLR